MLARRAAQQRAQQSLPKSLLLYADAPCAARTLPAPAWRAIDGCQPRPGNRSAHRPSFAVISTEPVLVVLDTNVVLDWLVFRDPNCDGLRRGLAAGRLHWIATPAMRDELAHVLARGDLAGWRPELAQIWAHWDEHAVVWPVPGPLGLSSPLRCTDPDDQKFIDLAIAAGARWLLSRDRAVLKLRRRLREFGVEATAPDAAWPEASIPAD